MRNQVSGVAERFGQPDGQLGGDPRLFVDQVVKDLPADFQDARGFGNAQAERFPEFLADHTAGMGPVFHDYAAS